MLMNWMKIVRNIYYIIVEMYVYSYDYYEEKRRGLTIGDYSFILKD
jgi:hypothetical protein